MRKITWVGINHYMTNEQLKTFYETVKENDIVFFALEPNNEWDCRAVAVYYRFMMCGHVSRYQTEFVHAMAEKGLVLVGRVTAEIDEELNQIEILVDDVCFQQDMGCRQPLLTTNAIGMDFMPFVSYEEESYRLVRNFVDSHIAIINQSGLGDESVRTSVTAINNALEIYMKIWNKSMSMEANYMPKYLQEKVDRLRMMSRDIEVELKDVYRRLKVVVSKQSKVERHLKDLTAQIDAVFDYYSRKDGFFDTFRKLNDDAGMLQARLDEIDAWLVALPLGVGEFWGKEFSHFATKMYCAGFCQHDYYLILAHIALHKKLRQWLYGNGEAVKVDTMVVNGDVNFYGEVVNNGGTLTGNVINK